MENSRGEEGGEKTLGQMPWGERKKEANAPPQANPENNAAKNLIHHYYFACRLSYFMYFYRGLFRL